MKFKDEEAFLHHWEQWNKFGEDESTILLPSDRYPRQLLECIKVVQKVVTGKNVLFTEGSRDTYLVSEPTCKVGSDLRNISKICILSIANEFRGIELNPYLEILIKVVERHSFSALDLYASADEANAFVAELRQQGRENGTKAAIHKSERTANANSRSARQYIDKLFSLCSRLLVSRIDLGMSIKFRKSLEADVDPLRMKDDLRRLLRRIRRRFPDLLGYIWKLEKGPFKSYHIHLLVLLDGNEVCKDIRISKAVGEIWKEITDGEGAYWNCNADKKKYAERGKLGVGMIEHHDSEMRENLQYAAGYLAKADSLIKLAQNLGRAFGKSEIPKPKRGTRGRPRKPRGAH
ncbi:hypothetical protein FHR55_003443 [Xanthomonas arboricola]